MWRKALTIVPNILGFLAAKSEKNPRAALGSAGGFAGVLGFLGSPDLQMAIRNSLADILLAAAEAVRQVPGING